MQVVSKELILGKKVLLRLDIDVLLKVKSQKSKGKSFEVGEDFRLRAGLPTIELCLHNASRTTIIGHLGRPKGRDPALSAQPIIEWLEDELGKSGYLGVFESGQLKILENLRFDPGEDACSLELAKALMADNDLFVNEAFAAHHKSASTTILPTLLPHAAGLRFAKEVEMLTAVRRNPKRPFVVIIGGVKLEDKLPAVEALSKIADAVLAGGKIASERTITSAIVQHNGRILPGKLNEEGSDLAAETVEGWQRLIEGAKMIVWSGPLGAVEDPKNTATARIAQMVINSQAETIVGGGDTIAYLSKLGMLDKFSFVSTGGGAMLKFLSEGTLPTIQALA